MGTGTGGSKKYKISPVRFRYMAVSVLEEKRGDWVTHSSGGMA